jgi:sugar phosphate isomerase/epimerase
MVTRRKFLNSASALIAGSICSPLLFSSPSGRKLKSFGFISGIIDKELLGDWKSIIKQAADLGYTEFETGGFLGESAGDFLAYCRETGLTPFAGTINFTDSEDQILKSIELINLLEMKYAVAYWPWFTGGPFSLPDCKKSADRMNYLGRICSAHGLQFCWHNHNKEFLSFGEGLPFDFLMNHTDAGLVKCELDIYWVVKGGSDPLSMLKKYKGRYSILHIKDMARGKEQDFECPGSGIIDFAPIFSEACSQGIEHFIVERDNVPDGMACLKSAADYLKNVTF